nr:dolichyl-diphosphooligosaccharide--protein glycosyltransferase subunit 2-like [Tanacetum cinerariifolium]
MAASPQALKITLKTKTHQWNGDGIRISCYIVALTSICLSMVVFHPISGSHTFVALELFCGWSLEGAYKALRIFEVLIIEKETVIVDVTCKSVVDTLSSPSSNANDLYHTLRVMAKLKGHQKRITGLAFSKLLGVLVSSGADAMIAYPKSVSLYLTLFLILGLPMGTLLQEFSMASCLVISLSTDHPERADLPLNFH